MAYTTIDDPTLYFETLTWTGDGNTPRSLSGLDFQPDMVWGKRRDDAAGHNILDAVRGAGLNKEIQTNGTGAEGAGRVGEFGYLSAFTSDGFTVTAGSSDNAYWNNSSATYVAWCWKANGSGSANTEGNTDTTISANTTAGFSIIDGCDDLNDDDTFGHGLNSAPNFVILKRLDDVSGWRVFYTGITSGSTLALNGTGAVASDDACIKSVSSTLITSKGSGTGGSEGTGENVAYAWHSVQGYSKVGKYTGNAADAGPFVYTGFRPAWIMCKAASDSGEAWAILDNKRNTYNPVLAKLFPNTSGADSATAGDNNVDFLSNGFKIITNDNGLNKTGVTFIYMAFAEAPFVNSNGVPVNAR